MQFVALFKLLNAPLESEVRLDVEESEQLLDKLYIEACQKFDLVSEVDFWKWCYKNANDRLVVCGC